MVRKVPASDEVRPSAVPDVPGLKRRVRLTLAGLLMEQAVRALWPAWCGLLAAYVFWKAGPLAESDLASVAWMIPAVLALWLAVRGIARIRFPTKAGAIRRIDRQFPFGPLSALEDRQATGVSDSVSRSLWSAHISRMALQAASAKAVGPDLRLSRSDRWALRYIAATSAIIALLLIPSPTVTDLSEDVAMRLLGRTADPGPAAFDAWVEPPAYTRELGLYLNSADGERRLSVPVGSSLSVRFHGDSESILLKTDFPEENSPETALRTWTIDGDGHLEASVHDEAILRREFTAIPDLPPKIAMPRDLEVGPFGRTELRLELQDDYGVSDSGVTVELDLSALDRRHGLAPEPEAVMSGRYRVPLPFGFRKDDIKTAFIADFGDHPWAGLPVEFEISASDAAGQAATIRLSLEEMPGRILLNPVAKALAEQRRDLLWSEENLARVAAVLRAISADPDETYWRPSSYLAVRTAIRILESALNDGTDIDRLRERVADLLWQTVLELEEGNVASARERLAEASRGLAEALERAAQAGDLERLREDYRQALQRFMAELAQRSMDLENESSSAEFDSSRQGALLEFDSSVLEELLSDFDRLLSEGRSEEAMRVLEQLQRLTENLAAARPRPGGGEAERNFRRSLESFSGAMQRQQGLMDEAFRSLQEQRGQEAAGASEENLGSSGGIGRGQDHSGSGSAGNGSKTSIEGRQETLRQDLRRLMNEFSGRGFMGESSTDAFEKAARSMTGARDRLRSGQLEKAIERQLEAIESLAEGIRGLGKSRTEQASEGNGGPPGTGATDPLGRVRVGESAGPGLFSVPEEMLKRRSQEVRDEIRRRAGEQDRPDYEIDYLKRLLELY